MLKDLHPVLPAADLARARTYYHHTLDLDPDEEVAGTLVYRPSPTSFFEIYETENAGTAKNTQMDRLTDDLDAEMTRLRERGVVFEDFEIPGMTTTNGVATMNDAKAAWFRKSEGNFLYIMQRL